MRLLFRVRPRKFRFPFAPERMLFRQFLEPGAGWQDQPTLRDRVLHLYELFEVDLASDRPVRHQESKRYVGSVCLSENLDD